jgi:predicted MPP superfamily phosphohydrolase
MKTVPARNSLKKFRSLLLIPVVLAVIAACYLYGRLIEVDWIRIKHVDMPIQGLPAEFDGFRIVQLSDLHVTEFGKREKKLPAMVNSVGADAMVITGDFTQIPEGDKIVASLISQLEAKHGKWGVEGNWDSTQTIRACEEAGLKMLMTETDVIKSDGEMLGIIGLRYGDTSQVVGMEAQRELISDLRSRFPDDAPVILLAHAPRIIRAAQEEDIDLVISGHTHGGQVRIPFGPAIETPSDMGVWYSKGLFKFKETYLYINPGIGLEPGPDYIQVRFCCRPEITVFVLHTEG